MSGCARNQQHRGGGHEGSCLRRQLSHRALRTVGPVEIEGDPRGQALNRHAKFLRGRLGRMIDMKFTPDLKFLHDESFDEAARMSRLFQDPRVARDLAPQPPSDGWKDED